MKYIEEIISLTVVSGQSTNGVEIATNGDGSTVVGAIINHNGLDKNPEMINAKIIAGGLPVSELQHIENYKMRNASFDECFKPLVEFESGKRVRFEIYSEANFTADFKAQLTLIKVKNCR